MSFAYLPLYTGDYFRDTRGLSMAGHGCYLLFLTYCWDTQGPLPVDEERLAGICEARNQEERLTMRRILETYFVRMEDGWYNQRMQREIERSSNISLARKVAGTKGYLARAKQLPNKSKASAKQLHLPPPPPPPLTSSPSPETPPLTPARIPDSEPVLQKTGGDEKEQTYKPVPLVTDHPGLERHARNMGINPERFESYDALRTHLIAEGQRRRAEAKGAR